MSRQTDRIEKMEGYLDECREVLDRFEESLQAYLSVQKKIKALDSYYSGKDWRRDFEADEAGKLPQKLKRGVLSEDLLYELLSDNDELLKKLRKLSDRYGK